jgi:hypothetical protein
VSFAAYWLGTTEMTRNFLLWLGTRIFLVLALTFSMTAAGLCGLGKPDFPVAGQILAVVGISVLAWCAGAACYLVRRPNSGA